MKVFISLLLIIVFSLLLYTQITIFIIPPIGAIPEGKTIVLWRYKVNDSGEISGLNLNFLETADSTCERLMGYVNLLCRGVILGTVAQNTTVLIRLPYSSTLQLLAKG